jgi:hypothetical protein
MMQCIWLMDEILVKARFEGRILLTVYLDFGYLLAVSFRNYLTPLNKIHHFDRKNVGQSHNVVSL